MKSIKRILTPHRISTTCIWIGENKTGKIATAISEWTVKIKGMNYKISAWFTIHKCLQHKVLAKYSRKLYSNCIQHGKIVFSISAIVKVSSWYNQHKVYGTIKDIAIHIHSSYTFQGQLCDWRSFYAFVYPSTKLGVTPFYFLVKQKQTKRNYRLHSWLSLHWFFCRATTKRYKATFWMSVNSIYCILETNDVRIFTNFTDTFQNSCRGIQQN